LALCCLPIDDSFLKKLIFNITNKLHPVIAMDVKFPTEVDAVQHLRHKGLYFKAVDGKCAVNRVIYLIDADLEFPQILCQKYQIKSIGKIGSGNFGEVWKALFKNEEIAIKLIKPGSIQTNNEARIEMTILQ
jgi:hypothetical protein